MVFSKGPIIKREFYFRNEIIENVKDFKYIGIIFSRLWSFKRANTHLCEQAKKAMYGVIRKIRHFNLPFDCQLDLFEKVVMPVLLYGCEVWGYKNIEIIERIHLKFLKHILNFKKMYSIIYGLWRNRKVPVIW